MIERETAQVCTFTDTFGSRKLTGSCQPLLVDSLDTKSAASAAAVGAAGDARSQALIKGGQVVILAEADLKHLD
jgi:hypothetical protein